MVLDIVRNLKSTRCTFNSSKSMTSIEIACSHSRINTTSEAERCVRSSVDNYLLQIISPIIENEVSILGLSENDVHGVSASSDSW